jgi:hypothetical protein
MYYEMCLRSLSPTSHTVPRAGVSSLAERCVNDALCQIFLSGYLARNPGHHERYFIEVTASACLAVALISVTCFTVSPSLLSFHIYLLFLFVYSNISIASYWFAVLRHGCHLRSFVFRDFPDVLQILQGNSTSGRVVAVAVLCLGYTVPSSNFGLGTYHTE